MGEGLFVPAVGYAELQAWSYFTYLQAPSSPEQLVETAVKLGLSALALTDHFSVAGWPRFERAARARGLHPVAGATVSLAEGGDLVLLVESAAGWRSLCRLISLAHGGLDEVADADWEGKVTPALTLDQVSAHTAGLLCILPSRHAPQGTVYEALSKTFTSRIWQALTDQWRGDDTVTNIAAARRAAAANVPLVVTGDVRQHTHALGPLRDVLLAIDNHMTLSEARAAGVLPGNHQAVLRTGSQHLARLPGLDDALAQSVAIAERCRFSLDLKQVEPPRFVTPPNRTSRQLFEDKCWSGFYERYALSDIEAKARLTHELDIVAQAGLHEYFLHAAELCEYAEANGIRHSGRGSAAGAMVSYCLDISQLCPLQFGLSFERFLNPQRSSPIDIDLDFDSERRDEVIRHALARHGRAHAALVSVNIEFGTRLAMRELAKTLEIPPDTASRYSQLHDRSSPHVAADAIDRELDEAGVARGGRHPLRLFCALLRQIEDIPRHRGQHPGGVVFTREPLCEWMPIERAAMPGRYVVQFDKDDLDDLGMPKLDLLGLRALTLVGEAERIIAARSSCKPDLHKLPGANFVPEARNHRWSAQSGYTLDDDPVWKQLEMADAIGLFQVQSRAQIQLIDKTKPADLMQLAIQIAIIRPGPIQGGLLQAYVERKMGLSPVTYLHPSLAGALKKTLGVPVFQENLMDLAQILAGFSPADADSLRRAANKKHALEALEGWRTRFQDGCAANGIDAATAAAGFDSVRGFAAFGFLLSHSASFARLAYVTMWLKYHEPLAFYVALLNSQSGFYSDEVIAGDLKRHGFRMLPLDVRDSQWRYSAEGNSGIRIGFWMLKGFNEDSYRTLDAERRLRPFVSLRDFAERVKLARDAIYELVRSGALDYLGERRQLLWELGEISGKADALALVHRPTPAALLALDDLERQQWDKETSGVSAEGSEMKFLQPLLSAQGYATLEEIRQLNDGDRVRTAAKVYLLQRPGTAKGVAFFGLNYDSGLCDLVVWPHLFEKYRSYLRLSPILKFEARVQRSGRSISLIFERPA